MRILDEYQREKGEFSLAGLTYKEMREAVEKLLEGITRGSQRIKEIVNNLKDFARQDTAGLGGTVAINKVIAASVAMLNNRSRNIRKISCGIRQRTAGNPWKLSATGAGGYQPPYERLGGPYFHRFRHPGTTSYDSSTTRSSWR